MHTDVPHRSNFVWLRIFSYGESYSLRGRKPQPLPPVMRRYVANSYDLSMNFGLKRVYAGSLNA